MRWNLCLDQANCDTLSETLRQAVLLRQRLDFAFLAAPVVVDHRWAALGDVWASGHHRRHISLAVVDVACESCAVVTALPRRTNVVYFVVNHALRFDADSAAFVGHRLQFESLGIALKL